MDIAIGKEFPAKVIPLINSAKRSIRAVVFDWRFYVNQPAHPVQLFNTALLLAKARGVDVRIVTNIDAVVQMFRSQNVDAKRPISKNLMHAKMMILDDEICVMGSHNYTQSAFSLNHEISVIFEGKEEVARCIDFFEALYNI